MTSKDLGYSSGERGSTMAKLTRILVLVSLFLAGHVFGNQDANSLEEAVLGGKPDLNLRVRGEFVNMDGLEETWGFTERLRLGYGSKSYRGFSFYVDMEDIRAFDDDRYNALPGGPLPKALIADPEDSELNQAYLKYQNEDFSFIGGRQRIILDDARFVGNVGWRQNEQTFDAATVKVGLPFGVTGQYSYLWDINRIFGPTADLDWDSDSHLFNVTGKCPVVGTFTGFAYLLDFDNSPANSSDTYGLRYTTQLELDKDHSLLPILSYARQVDSGTNTTDYQADYFLAQLGLKRQGLGTIGAGYEELGSDNGMAAGSFRTPLATGHAWNGWADNFLTTPAAGLEDFFVFASAPMPCGAVGRVSHHWFRSDAGSLDFGEELNAVLSKSLNDNVSVLFKFAYYTGSYASSVYPDVTKFWMQTEIKTK